MGVGIRCAHYCDLVKACSGAGLRPMVANATSTTVRTDEDMLARIILAEPWWLL